MIYAFYELCTTREHVRLHIMGGVDDEEYAQECYALVDQLHLENVIFTGRVDIISYMEKGSRRQWIRCALPELGDSAWGRMHRNE